MQCPYCDNPIVPRTGRQGKQKLTCGSIDCVRKRSKHYQTDYPSSRAKHIQDIEIFINSTILRSVPECTDKCFWDGIVGCELAHEKEAKLIHMIQQASDYYRTMFLNCAKTDTPIREALLKSENSRNMWFNKRDLSLAVIYFRVRNSKRSQY